MAAGPTRPAALSPTNYRVNRPAPTSGGWPCADLLVSSRRYEVSAVMWGRAQHRPGHGRKLERQGLRSKGVLVTAVWGHCIGVLLGVRGAQIASAQDSVFHDVLAVQVDESYLQMGRFGLMSPTGLVRSSAHQRQRLSLSRSSCGNHPANISLTAPSPRQARGLGDVRHSWRTSRPERSSGRNSCCYLMEVTFTVSVISVRILIRPSRQRFLTVLAGMSSSRLISVVLRPRK